MQDPSGHTCKELSFYKDLKNEALMNVFLLRRKLRSEGLLLTFAWLLIFLLFDYKHFLHKLKA